MWLTHKLCRRHTVASITKFDDTLDATIPWENAYQFEVFAKVNPLHQALRSHHPYRSLGVASPLCFMVMPLRITTDRPDLVIWYLAGGSSETSPHTVNHRSQLDPTGSSRPPLTLVNYTCYRVLIFNPEDEEAWRQTIVYVNCSHRIHHMQE